jgi:hypothetical protein
MLASSPLPDQVAACLFPLLPALRKALYDTSDTMHRDPQPRAAKVNHDIVLPARQAIASTLASVARIARSLDARSTPP